MDARTWPMARLLQALGYDVMQEVARMQTSPPGLHKQRQIR